MADIVLRDNLFGARRISQKSLKKLKIGDTVIVFTQFRSAIRFQTAEVTDIDTEGFICVRFFEEEVKGMRFKPDGIEDYEAMEGDNLAEIAETTAKAIKDLRNECRKRDAREKVKYIPEYSERWTQIANLLRVPECI